uniref:Radial spoke head 14 homolog n=1 Tax=Vombatus ursinus TaxID=29139 RepID=A0A4X2LHH9_VOMUR
GRICAQVFLTSGRLSIHCTSCPVKGRGLHQRPSTPKSRTLCSLSPPGAEAISKSGLIPRLVNKVKDEDEEIQELILDTLYFCLQWDASPALQSKAVPILREKLSSANEYIRSAAAHALMAICMPREGKNQVWEYGVIPVLVLLLDDRNIDVKANAAGALMFAAVTTAGQRGWNWGRGAA